MSFQAMAWAVKQSPTSSTQKLVLVMLANYASTDQGDAYPSLETLARDCSMNRSTVMRAIKALEDAGFLRVIRRKSESVNLPNIYRLPINGCAPGGSTVPLGVGAESDGGRRTVPLGVGAESDGGRRTVPLGVGAESDSNLSLEPINEPKNKSADKPRSGAKKPSINIPSWIPEQTWVAFADHRKAIRKPMTDEAAKRIIAKLDEWRKEGQDPDAVLGQSIEAGWTGIFRLKDDRKGGATASQDRKYRDLN